MSPDAPYTTRLQKGGALLDEMRQLMLHWSGGSGEAQRILTENPLALPTRARARDVIVRTFVPRFVKGDWPYLWRPLAVFERNGASLEQVRPIHYLAAARSEPLVLDFVCDFLWPRYSSGRLVGGITSRDAAEFINSQPADRFGGSRWTDTVTIKVARGLLAALRDFGVLEGRQRKTVHPAFLPVGSFAFIACMLYQSFGSGDKLLHAHDWRLYLLLPESVERLFFEAHQRKLLTYRAAGSVVQVEFPADSLEEYAHVILQRQA